MAIAFVQKIVGTGEVVNSVSMIFGSNNAAGNFISVGAFWYTADTNASASGDVTDTRNTYALDRSRINGTAHVGIWSALNVGAGANTVVVNPPAADAYLECVATEFSGLATTSALDVSADNAATSTTPTSGATGTTSQADTLSIAALSHVGSSATGIDLPTNYTNLHLVQDNSTQPGSVDYRILTATGTQSVSWGTTASGPWSAAVAVYKAAAGGGGPFSASGQSPIALVGALGIAASIAVARRIDPTPQSPIALQGSLAIAATVNFAAVIPVNPQAPIALQGALGITGDIAFQVKNWRIPTNAAAGTAVHVIVFSGTGPTYAILAQGDTTVDADGHAHIQAVGTIGAKAFAFVHNYDDNTETSSIYGGPCIATIFDVG